MTSPKHELPRHDLHGRWLRTFATLATCCSCWAGSVSLVQAQIRIVEGPPKAEAPATTDADSTTDEAAPTSGSGAKVGDSSDAAAPAATTEPKQRPADAPAVGGPVPAPGTPVPAKTAEPVSGPSGEPSRLDADQVAEADLLTHDGDPGDPGERGTGERSGAIAAVRLAPGTPNGSPSIAPIVSATAARPRVAAGPKPTVIHLTDGPGPDEPQIDPVVIDGEGVGSLGEGAPVVDRPAESPEMARLRADIDRCLRRYSVLYENSATRSPWGMMHAFLPWGVDAQVIVGNQKVNSIGYLCWNGACRKQKLFYQKNGEMGLFVGPGVQGHAGQFLAMLAQNRIDRDYEIRIDDYRYTIRDLIEYEKRTCVPKSELTFKLIAFSHYLDAGDTWNTPRHGRWNLERVLAEELAQPVVGSACGGTHRLMGITYAMRAREAQDQPMNGHFARAVTFIDDFQQYAMALQNPDGSFSTDWFERRANAPDFDRKVQVTGHILEWLVYSLPQDRLTDPKVVRSVRFVVDALNTNPDYEFEVGPKGHALRSLVLYQRLVFDGTYGQGMVQPAELAAEPDTSEPASSGIR